MTNFHPQMTLPQVVSIDGQLFFVTPNQSNYMPQRPPYQLQAQAQLQPQQIHTQQHQPLQAQPQPIQLQLQLQQHQQLQQQNHQQQQHQQQQQQLHQHQHQQQLHMQQLQVPLPIREPESSLLELVDSEDLQYLQQRQEEIIGQLEQQVPQVRSTSPVGNTNDKILKKVKSIKGGQYIGHYIDSQLIIETTEPFKEKKKKKKKKLLAQNQNLDNQERVIPNNQLRQQQQNHLLQDDNQCQQLVVHSHQRDQSDALISSAVQAEVAQSMNTNQNRPGSVVNVNSATNSDNDVILKIREDMKSWSVADVVEFIESQDDISAYSSKFAEDEIDGTALLYMIDRNLNMQVLSTMFKNGPAMKIEATLSKFKLKE